jgi:hypothetical protein
MPSWKAPATATGPSTCASRAGTSKSEKPVFENWLARPTPEDLRAYPSRDGKAVNLIERLIAAEAVDVLAYRAAPGKVHVLTKKGGVELSQTVGSRDVACRVLRGDDPLGYGASKAAALLDGKPHTPAEWLAATADTEFPDLAPQVMAYFDTPRAGDLALFAAPGWDFSHENKRGGHGGLRPDEMFTVLLIAGPGVPHERRSSPVRSVDLGPTILELLGRPVPADIDGRSLLKR